MTTTSLRADAAMRSYAGSDNTLMFRFYGLVTQRKVVSLWVATETRDTAVSQRVFDEVHGGLECFVP